MLSCRYFDLFSVAVLLLPCLKSTIPRESFRSGSLVNCQSFFTTLDLSTRSHCDDIMRIYGNNIAMFSSLMFKLNSKFTIYVSGVTIQCTTQVPAVSFVTLNVSKTLQSCHIPEDIIAAIESWSVQWSDVSRRTDIYRLCLQYLHGSTFLTIDSVPLSLDPTMYQHEFVAVEMHRNTGFNLQITNSAFCLNRDTLYRMMQYQIERIRFHTSIEVKENYVIVGEDVQVVTQRLILPRDDVPWADNELSSNMFLKFLFNGHPHRIAMYSQNHPSISR